MLMDDLVAEWIHIFSKITLSDNNCNNSHLRVRMIYTTKQLRTGAPCYESKVAMVS